MAEWISTGYYRSRRVITHLVRQGLRRIGDVGNIPAGDTGYVAAHKKRRVIRLIVLGCSGGLRLEPGRVVVNVRQLGLPVSDVGNVNLRDQTNDAQIKVRLTQVVVGIGPADLGCSVRCILTDQIGQSVLSI